MDVEKLYTKFLLFCSVLQNNLYFKIMIYITHRTPWFFYTFLSLQYLYPDISTPECE